MLEIDAAEKERTRQILKRINAQREAKRPYKRARLWQVGLLCLLAALAGLAAFHWWLDGSLRSIGL